MIQKLKSGLLSRLFGRGGSGCCNLRIEEVPDEEDNADAVPGSESGDESCCRDDGEGSCPCCRPRSV